MRRGRPQEVLAHVRLAENALNRFRDPVVLGPFLEWVEQRRARMNRELDAFPLIEGGQTYTENRIAAECGWEGDSGIRRLYRWQYESYGYAERADVEDALEHAGVDFYALYPEFAHELERGEEAYCTACKLDVLTTDGLCPWCEAATRDSRPPQSISRIGQGRLITEKQIRAAYVLYDRKGLSLGQLAEMLYKSLGYANARSAESQIRRHFQTLGLPRRTPEEGSRAAHWKHGLCVDGKRTALYRRKMNIAAHGQCEHTLSTGERCPRAAHAGVTHCGYHRPEEVARRTATILRRNRAGRDAFLDSRDAAHELPDGSLPEAA